MIDHLELGTTTENPNHPSAAVYVCSSLMANLGQPTGRLTDNEVALSKRLTSPTRQQEFIAGRILAKQAIQQLNSESIELSQSRADAYEILSEDTSKSSSRPIVFRNGRRAEINVSVSHCSGHAVAAASESRCRLGIDIVRIGSVTSSTRSLWFSDSELQQVDNSSDSETAAAKIWSMKEAAFKAAGVTPDFHPRKWVVSTQNNKPQIHFDSTKTHLAFQFFLSTDNLLLTIAMDSAFTANFAGNETFADRVFY